MSVPSSGGLSCHLNKVIVPVASRLQVLPPTHRIKGLVHARRLQLVEWPPAPSLGPVLSTCPPCQRAASPLSPCLPHSPSSPQLPRVLTCS